MIARHDTRRVAHTSNVEDQVVTQATSSELPKQGVKAVRFRWLGDTEYVWKCR